MLTARSSVLLEWRVYLRAEVGSEARKVVKSWIIKVTISYVKDFRFCRVYKEWRIIEVVLDFHFGILFWRVGG